MRGNHLGRLGLIRATTSAKNMASEDDAKNDLVDANEQKDELHDKTENNDAATSDAKGESSDDKKNDNEEEKEVKLYVGNLPDHCRRGALQELFEKYGKVSQCDIVKNFAFVVRLIKTLYNVQAEPSTCQLWKLINGVVGYIFGKAVGS